jgi:hypothetical protein
VFFRLRPPRSFRRFEASSPNHFPRGRIRTLRAKLSLLVSLVAGLGAARAETYDVVVYGGSSAGVIAAVQAARMGKATLLISPTHHIGGMTASGLGTTDTGNAGTIGGLAYVFYASVDRAYHDGEPASPSVVASKAHAAVTNGPMNGVTFDFEPHVAEAVFWAMLENSGASCLLDEPLDRANGVIKTGRRITSLQMKSGRRVSGRVVVDATYEGDLMAAAGVPYRVGREDRTTYGESLAGVRVVEILNGEVDPFSAPGNPASGLLPGVSPIDPGPDGTGDERVQQFNLRLCATNNPANRVPFTQPATYDDSDYELLRRRLRLHPDFRIGEVLKIQPLPGGKADINANGSFSTDMAGDESRRWIEATDEQRTALYSRYRDYTAGLFWFLTHDPAVPPGIRREAEQWGLAADEFNDSDHWPWQLYVREARRMIGEYVMTQHDCEGRVTAADPVALGSYSMVSHKVTLFVNRNGQLATEGFFSGAVEPYPISYRAIIPKAADCENLLVPICVSATHVAFNSVRMEPVYMMLGQAAGTAAALAATFDTSVQSISYPRMARQLTSDGQILKWPRTTQDALTDEPENEPAPARKGGRRRALLW